MFNVADESSLLNDSWSSIRFSYYTYVTSNWCAIFVGCSSNSSTTSWINIFLIKVSLICLFITSSFVDVFNWGYFDTHIYNFFFYGGFDLIYLKVPCKVCLILEFSSSSIRVFCALSIIGLPLVTYWLLTSTTLTLIWFRYSCCIE